MKKLFAQITYSYDNFYNNLNPRGQMIFSVIMFLILVLVAILFINYIVQGIKNRQKIKKILKDKKENVKEEKKEEPKEEKSDTNIYKYDEDKTEIQDIASSIEKALMEDAPISLTNFEEDQEKTAIISIDELYKKAKELEMIEDEQTGVNYLEKYNLDASVEEPEKKEDNTPIKSFKVSQVISPVYGVKKEVINKDKY